MREFRAFRTQMVSGNWDVGIEIIDDDRPDPDPWGQGRIVLMHTARGLEPDKDYDNDGLAISYRVITDQPPHASRGAYMKAKRLANRLNSGELTEERVRYIRSQM